MKNDLLKYKGYFGSVQYSEEDGCLYGKVQFIDDLILYEGLSVEELKSAFQEAVDDYLESCEASGSHPNTTCKGSFNVRVGEELHKALAVEAMRNRQSLNEFVKTALSEKINGGPVVRLISGIARKSQTSALVVRSTIRKESVWPLEELNESTMTIREHEKSGEIEWRH